MRKSFLFSVLLASLALLFVSCGGIGIGFTLGDAQGQFIGWIAGQGAAAGSVGFYLGGVGAGSVVGSFEPATAGARTSRNSGPLPEAGWLFYLDEAPGALYNHPGKILVIGESGANLYSEDTQGWPIVDGERPQTLKDNSIQQIIANNNITIYNPWNVWIPVQIIKWPGVVFQLARYGAVVTSGLTPTQNLFTEVENVHAMMVDAMEDLMNGGGTYDNVRSVKNPNNDPTDFANAVADLINNESVNNLTLYFIAHGSNQYMNIGGFGYTAATLKTLIDSYPNVNFTLIIESCHAGSWLEYFEDLGAEEVPNLDMVITSTSDTKSAYPDWDNASGLTDWNAADDVWIEWTSDFILSMEFYTAAANWPTVTGLTNPPLANNKLRLYYLCYKRVKTNNPGANSLVLTERTPINIQEPWIYLP